MQLTKNFTLAELIKSGSRPELVTEPDQMIKDFLFLFCETVLQPLRDKLNSPVIVHSGWRNPKLNAAVGGVPRSKHLIMVGEKFIGVAADISTPGNPIKHTAKLVYDHTQATKIIYYPDENRLHVEISPKKSKHKEVFVKKGSRYHPVLIVPHYDWSKLGD